MNVYGSALLRSYISSLEEFKLISETILEREGWGEPEERARLIELSEIIENHAGRYGGIVQHGPEREH